MAPLLAKCVGFVINGEGPTNFSVCVIATKLLKSHVYPVATSKPICTCILRILVTACNL